MSEIWFMVRYTFVSKSLHSILDAVFPKNLTFFPRRYSGLSCTSTQPITCSPKNICHAFFIKSSILKLKINCVVWNMMTRNNYLINFSSVVHVDTMCINFIENLKKKINQIKSRYIYGKINKYSQISGLFKEINFPKRLKMKFPSVKETFDKRGRFFNVFRITKEMWKAIKSRGTIQFSLSSLSTSKTNVKLDIVRIHLILKNIASRNRWLILEKTRQWNQTSLFWSILQFLASANSYF